MWETSCSFPFDIQLKNRFNGVSIVSPPLPPVVVKLGLPIKTPMIVLIVVKCQNKKGTKALIENKIHGRSAEREAVKEVKTIRKWSGLDRVPRLGYMYTFLLPNFSAQMSWTVRYKSPFSALLGVSLAFVEGERSGI